MREVSSRVFACCAKPEDRDTNERCQRPSIQADAAALSREKDLCEMLGKVRNNEQAIEAYIEVVGGMKRRMEVGCHYTYVSKLGGFFYCVSQQDAKGVEGLSAAELIKVDPARMCYPTGLRNRISGLS